MNNALSSIDCRRLGGCYMVNLTFLCSQIQLIDPAYKVWYFDTQYCLTGQRVMFTVLNADGTAVPPSTGADPPSLNAPEPEPEDPNVPPPPVGIAGGPAPNSAITNGRVTWMQVVGIAFISYFATSVL